MAEFNSFAGWTTSWEQQSPKQLRIFPLPSLSSSASLPIPPSLLLLQSPVDLCVCVVVVVAVVVQGEGGDIDPLLPDAAVLIWA